MAYPCGLWDKAYIFDIQTLSHDRKKNPWLGNYNICLLKELATDMQLSVAIETLVFDHGYAKWLQMPNMWKSVHLPKFCAEFIRSVARMFNFALLFCTWVKLILCLSNEMLSRVQGASPSVLIKAADRWRSLGTASKEKPWPWGLQLHLTRS